MSILTKKGEAFTFNNIEKTEYPNLNKFFIEKNIKVSSDQDIEGEDNIVITKKVRKAPEVNIDDFKLPSEEESFVDDDDASFDDEEEDNGDN